MASVKSNTWKNGKTVRWEVRWKEPNGTNGERGGFKTKGEAERHGIEMEHQKVTGDYIGKGEGDVPFGEYAAETLEVEAVRKGTVENTVIQQARLLRVHLLPRFGDRPLNSITYEDVEALVTERTRAGLSPSTVRQILNVLKRTMGRAIKARRIRHDPTAGIRVEVPESESALVVDLAQVEALADATTPRRAHLAERSQLPALVRFGYKTGRRWGEVTGLQARLVTIHIPGTEDLPLDKAVAKYGAEGLDGFEGSHDLSDPRSVLKEANGTVRDEAGQLKLGQAKNSQSRKVFPLSAEVVALLASHVERFGLGESGLVFTNQAGKAISRSTFRRYWTAATADVLGHGYRFHDLRSTFLAHVREYGQASWETGQELVGHSKGRSVTARHYATQSDTLQREALRKLAKARTSGGDLGGMEPVEPVEVGTR